MDKESKSQGGEMTCQNSHIYLQVMVPESEP